MVWGMYYWLPRQERKTHSSDELASGARLLHGRSAHRSEPGAQDPAQAQPAMAARRAQLVLDFEAELRTRAGQPHSNDPAWRAVVDRVVEQGLHEALEHGWRAPCARIQPEDHGHEGKAVAKLSIVFDKVPHDGNGIVEAILAVALQGARHLEDALRHAEHAEHRIFYDLAPGLQVRRRALLGKKTGSRSQESQRASQLMYNKGHGIWGFRVHAMSTFHE